VKRVVSISDAALEELDEVSAYLAIEGSPEAADRWLAVMLLAIHGLHSMPERCPLALEEQFNLSKGKPRLRQLIVGNYRVIFTVKGRAVRVLHVRHAARRPLTPEELG